MVERPRFQGERIDGKIWIKEDDYEYEWETHALLDHDCIQGRVFVATRDKISIGRDQYVGIIRETDSGLFTVIAKEEREHAILRRRDPVKQGKELLEDTVRAETSQAVNNSQTENE